MRTIFIVGLALTALAAAPAAFAQDPLANLGRNVAAVMSPGPDGRILLLEESHGTSNIRTLAVGDTYAGWRIGGIEAQSLTLHRGEETRVIAILGHPARASEQTALAPLAAFSSAPPFVAQPPGVLARRGESSLFEGPGPTVQPYDGGDTPLALPLAPRQAAEALRSAGVTPAEELTPVDLSTPPKLTPEIEAELKRSLGIR